MKIHFFYWLASSASRLDDWPARLGRPGSGWGPAGWLASWPAGRGRPPTGWQVPPAGRRAPDARRLALGPVLGACRVPGAALTIATLPVDGLWRRFSQTRLLQTQHTAFADPAVLKFPWPDCSQELVLHKQVTTL